MKYVADNPRRYIYKKRYPDLFRRYLHLSLVNHEFAAFGNIFLLKEMYLLPVRIHRRWSEAQFREYSERCRREIDKGAIPITPAIHPAEKAIIYYARETGGKMIILKEIHCRLHRIPPHERPGPRHSLPLLIRPRLPEPEIKIDFSA